MKIKFVFFDVGGVIYKFKDQFDVIGKKFNINTTIANRVWEENIEDLCNGDIQVNLVWERICQAANRQNCLQEDLNRERAAAFLSINETHQFIRFLSKTNIKIGIISNAEKGIISQSILAGKIPNIKYECIIESANIGLQKPTRKIFDYAQSLIKVPKENVLLIDDTKENIVAANKFGWNTYLFDEKDPGKCITEIKNLLFND